MRWLFDIYYSGLEFLFPSRSGVVWEQETPTSLTQYVRYRSVYDDSFALFHFREPKIQELIWILKYRGKKEIGEIFGKALAYQHERLPDHDIVMPIPLSKERFHGRGFNQSAVIARAYAEYTPRRTAIDTTSLIRIRNNEHQVGLSRGGRKHSVEGAFLVANSSPIVGKRILLVDDVVTTGSTFEEARKTLLEAGAKDVSCVAVAH